MKTKTIWLCLMLFLCAKPNNISAQKINFDNSQLQAIAIPTKASNWIKFRPDSNIKAESIFEEYKSAFNLDKDDEMRLINTFTDQFGLTHFKFQQYYKGIKVEGVQFIIHAKDNIALHGNGKIVTNITLDTNAKIVPIVSIEQAKKSLPADIYMWEDKEEEQRLKMLKEDHHASYFPKPELLITTDNFEFKGDASTYRLRYKVDIRTKSPHAGEAIYIDANSGEFVKKYSLIHKCIDTEACTLYNGDRQINTQEYSDIFNPQVTFRLFDDCRGQGVHTRNFNDLADIETNDNVWSTISECHGASAHWALEMTYDYYFNDHGRLSFDGNDSRINAFINSNLQGDEDNAFYDPILTTINFGNGNDGLTTGPLTSLDIAGHEFTHGVIISSADLFYSGEPGGLNESFADIFGAMVEFSVENEDGTGNYQIAEDMWIQDGYLRNMADPKAKTGNISNTNGPSPDTYQGEYWNLLLGNHKTSGIQNHWFYLLAEGSSETDEVNDNGDAFSVIPIGRDNAAAIAYRNLTVYLTQSSNYLDAREGSIQAAIDLYGECSNQVLQVEAAWDAVGVYGESSACLECDDNLVLNEVYDNEVFQVTGAIVAQGAVLAPKNVTFRAEGYIILNEVFLADNGSVMCAEIAPCQNNANGLLENNSGNYVTEPASKRSQFENLEKELTDGIAIKNYPNPFSKETTFEFDLPEDTIVSLEIFDATGRLMEVLIQEETMTRGIHTIEFNADAVPPGIYMYRLTTEHAQSVHKMFIER